ncbi:hypothetical protein MG290_05425 [Flavobacterium sp. CBA20B-1]|uniref:hypothetical protein n=1 Tax=unclassified Flavobacterium TaxID=196869 RepID=UPI0022249EB3|nr:MULTISPECIES: hypothetical protein [unclassified Flavobacterium]WCM43113.1 hypothetical protein MG290_05425 [Flavobacterium sp. CBA20B-1]
MKIIFLFSALFFLVISCNKVENKPVEDYKVIETDHFIIKSKYDLKVNKELIPNSLLKQINFKDSLSYLYLYVTNDDFRIDVYDEIFIDDEEKFQEIDRKHSKIFNVDTPTVYNDTVINSYKAKSSELKIDKDLIYYNVRLFNNKDCYILSLSTKENKIKEHKKVFLEILEGTTIKQ